MSKVVVRKNLNRWFKEKWGDVSRRDKDGKHPPCGRKKAKKGSKGYPKCRPSVRVSSKTPKTSGEMTSGQKRAATKRKRSKKQGVGGKPTVVKSVLAKAPRIPRKKGQPAGSKKHSDLYTDENPKGTIHGLGFKNPAKARQSVSKIKNSSRSHAHKTQAAIAMEQRADEMGKKEEADIYRDFIEQQKKKTRQMKKSVLVSKQDYPFEAVDTAAPDPVVDTFVSMHRKVPTKMRQFEAMERARKDPLTHPGFSASDIFDTSLGQAQAVEPTIAGTNAPFTQPNPRPTIFGQQFQIADPKQMSRIYRMRDDTHREGVHDGMVAAEELQMPRVQTQLVTPLDRNKLDSRGFYGDAMVNLPSFRGMPFNEETYFTTGEPMDLAFRLLKRDMSHCNCNAPKGFSCRAHCKSKEKR